MTKEEKILRRRVVSAIGAGVCATPEVVQLVRRDDPTIGEGKARRMVWRLLDRGEIELTADRKLALRV